MERRSIQVPRFATPSEWCRVTRAYMYRPFPQFLDLSSTSFLSFLEKCDLNISSSTLRALEESGLVYPLFRSTLNHKTSWTETYFPGQQKFSELRNRQPPASHEDHISHTDIYHPFQILQIDRMTSGGTIHRLSQLLAGVEHSSGLMDHSTGITVKNIALVVRMWQKRGLINLLRLLMTIEQVYRPQCIGTVSLHAFPWKTRYGQPTLAGWYRFCDRFDAPHVLEKSGLTSEDIRFWHEKFSMRATNLDPLEKWYYLVRHVDWEHRKKLKGKALLAQYYYLFAEMIRLFAEDAASLKLPRENLWTDPNDRQDFERRWFGAKVSFKDPKILGFILNEYRLNPQPLLKVFVEGGSEKRALELIADRMGIDLSSEGIEIEDLHGEGNVRAHKLNLYLPDLEHRHIRFLFLLDPHSEAKKHVEQLFSMKSPTNPNRTILGRDKVIIWKQDFERDNFSLREIARALNRQIPRKHGCRFTARDLKDDSYRTGRCGLDNLFQKKIRYAHPTLNKIRLSQDLFNDFFERHKRTKPGSQKLIDFFYQMLRVARTNVRPTSIHDEMVL